MGEPEIVTEIKDAIRASETVDQVKACADKYRAQVKALASTPDTKVFAIHISNLKIWKITDIGRKAGG